jgi:hypothetical protein
MLRILPFEIMLLILFSSVHRSRSVPVA